jgi:hypothetical protein
MKLPFVRRRRLEAAQNSADHYHELLDVSRASCAEWEQRARSAEEKLGEAHHVIDGLAGTLDSTNRAVRDYRSKRLAEESTPESRRILAGLVGVGGDR